MFLQALLAIQDPLALFSQDFPLRDRWKEASRKFLSIKLKTSAPVLEQMFFFTTVGREVESPPQL